MPWLTPYPMHPVGNRMWIMLEHAIYKPRTGKLIHIPRGFLSDLASIPRFAQSIIPVNGQHRGATLPHDLSFVLQDRPLLEAHRIFYDAMTEDEVRSTQRRVMYAAVVAGGWVSWRKNTRDRAADLAGFLQRYNLGPRAVSVNEYLARHKIPPVLEHTTSLPEFLRRYGIDPADVCANDHDAIFALCATAA